VDDGGEGWVNDLSMTTTNGVVVVAGNGDAQYGGQVSDCCPERVKPSIQ